MAVAVSSSGVARSPSAVTSVAAAGGERTTASGCSLGGDSLPAAVLSHYLLLCFSYL